MKTLVIRTVVTFFLFVSATSQGASIKVGGHGGYTLGGDIEDEDIAFGAQVVIPVLDSFSIELAASSYSDEASESSSGVVGTLELDVISITLSGRAEARINERAVLYGFAGGGYYLVDGDFSISAAEALGVTSSFNFDPDDEFGFHLGGGVAVALSDKLELFADYRYVFLEIDNSLSGTASGPGGVVSVRQDSSVDFDHGLARVGVNMSF